MTASPLSSARASVAQADRSSIDRLSCLREALDGLGWSELLAEIAQRADKVVPELRVVIKVDLSSRDPRAPTGTEPESAEALIDLLYGLGCRDVVLADSEDPAGRVLENRDLLARADLLGFAFVTPCGHPYDIVDLADDPEPAAFPVGGVLEGEALSATWQQADLRIVLARNRTHSTYRYALTLQDLAGVLPSAKSPLRHEPGAVAVELLRCAPPHLAIIDAWLSSDGHHGQLVARPNPTRCFIAGTHAVLTDWVGAMRMGQDPFAHPMLGAALRELGLPEAHEVSGPTEPYAQWHPVHPWLAAAQSTLAASPEHERIQQWLAPADTESFPFQSPLEGRIGGWLSDLAQEANGNPAALAAVVGSELAAAGCLRWSRAWQTVADKGRLQRREVPLGFDPGRYSEDAYLELPRYLAPLERLAAQAPVAGEGLRWRYLDGAVLLEFEAPIDAPFDDFVARVEVGHAIQWVNDYIGGRSVVVRRDDRGRPIRCATRRIYLPQPNPTALVGGLPIDVCKLEVSEYRDDVHKVWWRTVHSPNASAIFDDGSLALRRDDTGGTCVQVVARQQFALPPALAALKIDRYPWVTDRLVTAAYQRFFTRTAENLQAVYEGRDPCIGRSREEVESTGATLEARFGALSERVMAAVAQPAELLAGLKKWSRRPRPEHVDEDGFAHFPSQPQVTP